ncbi:hypothetical protein [Azohydromonas aeria]|uniref:hypothetical protein n=1 Tax=Azohydromonas aeria TaxID=2590212 RepID=UPI0012FA5668|nr:hypothetical protein [Azohydromonas aeria]
MSEFRTLKPRAARPGEVSEHFPPDVRSRLIDAAAVDCDVRRSHQVCEAEAWAQRCYPELFRSPSDPLPPLLRRPWPKAA